MSDTINILISASYALWSKVDFLEITTVFDF